MRSILAVSDLTPGSDGALSTAARLAERTGAALHVLHAMDIVGMPLWEAVQTDVGRRIRDAERALAEQVRRTVSEGCAPASRALRFRGLGESVAQGARETRASLVVLGAADRGSPGALRRQALAEAAAVSVPTLLVHDAPCPPPRRVLLPLSPAEAGEGVLAEVCEWLGLVAWRAPAELRVLHVASGPGEWRALAAVDAELRRVAAQARWRTRLRFLRDTRWSLAPDVEILRAAADEAPDLVVLGPGCGVAGSPVHPRDARAALLRGLACPLLLLPGMPPPEDEEGGAIEDEPFAGEPGPAAELAAAD